MRGWNKKKTKNKKKENIEWFLGRSFLLVEENGKPPLPNAKYETKSKVHHVVLQIGFKFHGVI